MLHKQEININEVVSKIKEALEKFEREFNENHRLGGQFRKCIKKAIEKAKQYIETNEFKNALIEFFYQNRTNKLKIFLCVSYNRYASGGYILIYDKVKNEAYVKKNYITYVNNYSFIF